MAGYSKKYILYSLNKTFPNTLLNSKNEINQLNSYLDVPIKTNIPSTISNVYYAYDDYSAGYLLSYGLNTTHLISSFSSNGHKLSYVIKSAIKSNRNVIYYYNNKWYLYEYDNN